MNEYITNSCRTTRTRQSFHAFGVSLAWVGLFALLVVVAMVLLRKQQGPVAVGQKPPAFTLTTFDGQQIGPCRNGRQSGPGQFLGFLVQAM